MKNMAASGHNSAPAVPVTDIKSQPPWKPELLQVSRILSTMACLLIGATGSVMAFDAFVFPKLVQKGNGPAVRGVPRVGRLIPLLKMEIGDEAGDINLDDPSQSWKHASGEYAELSTKTREALKELDMRLYADSKGTIEGVQKALIEHEQELKEFEVTVGENPRQKLQDLAFAIPVELTKIMHKAGMPIPEDIRVDQESGRIQEYTSDQRKLFDPNQRPTLVQDHLFFDWTGQRQKSERMAQASMALVSETALELDEFRRTVISLIEIADWNGSELRAHKLSSDSDDLARKELATAIVDSCQQSRRAFLMLALAWTDIVAEDRVYDAELVAKSPFEAAKSDAALTRFIATQYIALRITEQAANSSLFEDERMSSVRHTLNLYSKHMRARLMNAGEWVDQRAKVDRLLSAKIELNSSNLASKGH